MTCWCFPQLQIQVLEQMSSNFQSTIRPGTVAKSFYQETPEKKCEGTDEGKIFCDFLKEKKSLSTPQKVASRALKIHFDSQAAEYGPSIFYQQY